MQHLLFLEYVLFLIIMLHPGGHANKFIIGSDAKFHDQATGSRRSHSKNVTNGHDFEDLLNVMTNLSEYVNSWQTNQSIIDYVGNSTVALLHVTPNITTTTGYTTVEISTKRNMTASSAAFTVTSRKPPSNSSTTQWFTSKPYKTTITSTPSTGFTITATKETILGNVWDGWKNIFNKSYWQKRIHDHHYLMEVFLPVIAGIALGVAALLCVLFFRCLLHLQCKKRRKRNRVEKYDKNLASDKWMLLERDFTDESEEI